MSAGLAVRDARNPFAIRLGRGVRSERRRPPVGKPAAEVETVAERIGRIGHERVDAEGRRRAASDG